MTSDSPDSKDFRRDEVIAGEYVLGVLSADDRRKVEARMVLDRNFFIMVQRWQDNLSSFDDDYETLAPPPLVYQSIERRLFAAPPSGASAPVGWWNSLVLWRGLALASVVATAAVVSIESDLLVKPPSASPLVAEMTTEGAQVSLVAQYDATSGRMRVTPVAAREPEARSLELWLIEGDRAPQSLGVLPQTGEGEVVIAPDMRAKLFAGATLAVSIEPFGGSTTGTASGPVIAVGTARNL